MQDHVCMQVRRLPRQPEEASQGVQLIFKSLLHPCRPAVLIIVHPASKAMYLFRNEHSY